MSEMSTWESLLLGVLALLVILWWRPGLKAAWQRSQEAEKDWPAALLPLGAVVLFVLLLLLMV